jgi:hypothetical protein
MPGFGIVYLGIGFLLLRRVSCPDKLWSIIFYI